MHPGTEWPGPGSVSITPTRHKETGPSAGLTARSAATFAVLTQTRAIDELDADHWMARWEREAERQGVDRFSADFWAAGRDWIAESRR